MSTSVGAAAGPIARADALRYGARLGGAVLLAFAASAALRLPEGFWAVMSALIVVRADAGSTFGAGWDRIRGALAGTALGLAGVALRRHGGSGTELTSLLLVALLAFAAGIWPALRAAPISALIIVSSGGIAGHSAWQVATLRAVEIGIGVAAALLVALIGHRGRARAHFRAAAAAQLRALAASLDTPPHADAREAADAERRTSLRRLAVLADAADREARLVGWRRRELDRERHRRTARLVSRTASDVALFERSARFAPTPAAAGGAREEDDGHRAARARAVERLHAAAAAIESATAFEGTARAKPSRAGDPTGPRAQDWALALVEGDLLGIVRNEGREVQAAPLANDR